VDIDPLLVEPLREQVPDNVTVIQGDVLKIDLAVVLPAGCRIYGSLPYNITSPILFRLLEQRGRWWDAHFIVQREVAERMAASPGSKVYGRLSVMVQAFTAVRKCFDLPPDVFRPRPKVASALIRLEPAEQHGSIKDEELFAQAVRLAFGQRRKKLTNALKELKIGGLLEELGLAYLRAEQVPVAEYIKLADMILNRRC
jgi:16S rRNA (adenine1518-N6/adenine1519-N6)-dimethyltransferase